MKLYPSFFAVLCFVSPRFASGGVAQITDLPCVNVDEDVFCATGVYYSPSPAMFEDGTGGYIGGWESVFTFYERIEEGANTTVYRTGLSTFVRREDDNSCQVGFAVDGVTTVCPSCSYCDDDSDYSGLYSYDCRGLQYQNLAGVIASECTSTGETVFFPFSSTEGSNAADDTSFTTEGLPVPFSSTEGSNATDDTSVTTEGLPVLTDEEGTSASSRQFPVACVYSLSVLLGSLALVY
jgi:hypothetical protein